MPNVKRVLSVILILALALTAFGGLGGCQQKPTGPLTILFDFNTPVSNAEYCVEDFIRVIKEKGGPADIETIIVPPVEDAADRQSMLTRIRTEVMAGEGPDVYIVSCAKGGGNEIPLFPMPEKSKDLGLFYPLDNFIEKAQFMEWDKLTPQIMAAGRSEKYGQVLLPITYTAPVAYVEAGSVEYTPSKEKTWSDILRDTSLPDVVRYAAVRDFLEYLSLGELADYSENHHLLFTEDELVNIILDDRELIQQNPNYMDLFGENFLRGRMSVNFDWNSTGTWEDYDVIPSYSDDGGLCAEICSFGAINANTKRPQDAFFVLDLLLSKDSQQYYNVATSLCKDTTVLTYEGIMTEAEPMAGTGRDKWAMSDKTYASFCQARDSITHVVFGDTITVELENLMRACIMQDYSEERIRAEVHEAYSRMEIELGE